MANELVGGNNVAFGNTQPALSAWQVGITGERKEMEGKLAEQNKKVWNGVT